MNTILIVLLVAALVFGGYKLYKKNKTAHPTDTFTQSPQEEEESHEVDDEKDEQHSH